MTANNEPMAYSIADAVKATSISRATLYIAMGEGHLKSRKVGGRRLILREDLQAYLRGDEPTRAAA